MSWSSGFRDCFELVPPWPNRLTCSASLNAMGRRFDGSDGGVAEYTREVRGSDRAQLRVQGRLPRHALAARGSGLVAVPEKDALDSPNDELFPHGGHNRAPDPATRRAIVLAVDQFADQRRIVSGVTRPAHWPSR